MKKISRKIFGLLAASALFAGVFVSCSNGSDSPSVPANPTGTTQNGTTTSLSDSATVKEVAQVATSVTSASYSSNTATLAASNGTYVFTGTAAQPNIAISADAAQTNSGTWKFTETNATSPKSMGSYTGDISTIGSSDTTLTLKVEKILNNGLLTAVVEKKDISMTVPTSGTFDATIPAVKVSSVTSYILAKMGGGKNPQNVYSSYTTIIRLDLSSDGKITYSAIGSEKGTNSPLDDNTTKFASGTYTIADGKLTGILFGKAKILKIDAEGNLLEDDGKEYFLTSGSYKIYANATAAIDGENSYAQQRIINLNEDSGKTGKVMDYKKIVSADTNRVEKNITYSISGNTVTLTGTGTDAGYSKTATLSADGKKLTLDGVVYIKL